MKPASSDRPNRSGPGRGFVWTIALLILIAVYALGECTGRHSAEHPPASRWDTPSTPSP